MRSFIAYWLWHGEKTLPENSQAQNYLSKDLKNIEKNVINRL